MSFAPEPETLAKPETLMRVPVGLASPLWGLFAGAAMTGATWWWMTRWLQPQNLEAMLGATAKFEAAVAPEAAAFAAPAEAVVAVVEATPAPALEALPEAPVAPEAVGGESAPVSPLAEGVKPEVAEPAATAEADIALKPKKKATEPKSA